MVLILILGRKGIRRGGAGREGAGAGLHGAWPPHCSTRWNNCSTLFPLGWNHSARNCAHAPCHACTMHDGAWCMVHGASGQSSGLDGRWRPERLLSPRGRGGAGSPGPGPPSPPSPRLDTSPSSSPSHPHLSSILRPPRAPASSRSIPRITALVSRKSAVSFRTPGVRAPGSCPPRAPGRRRGPRAISPPRGEEHVFR